MNFELFKKHNRKTILITGVISFSFLLINLVIIFSLSAVDMEQRIISLIQLLVNVLFIYIFIIMIHKSQSMIAWIYTIETFKDPETKQVLKTRFGINKWIHLIVIILCLVLFIIEITIISFWTKDWIEGLKQYWWIIFILAWYNFIILELSFGITKYLYNEDQELLNN